MVLIGNGAPDSKKREPIGVVPLGKIGLMAGQTLPSFAVIKGFEPVNPVFPPLEAKKA
jgi:hypothetical protein